MKYIFFIAPILTFLISFLSTKFIIKIAYFFDITDNSDNKRKIHKGNIPLLGGLAIFFAYFFVLFIYHDNLLIGNLNYLHWSGFFVGACFLMLGGYFDDKYKLNPWQQIIWPILAIISLISGGVGIEKITNPFGGYIYLGWVSSILIFVWLMGIMYTTKLLDGLDGLVTGTTAIGALIIFLFTMTTKYYQPDIGFAALIFSGACLGFLVFNWHPAKIFLGEGGSLLLGYILGVLAIISGGKIAIALLVMGIPIMDVVWTIVRRLISGKNPFRIADRRHLHFRLYDLGLSQRQTVSLYYLIALIFGLAALFLQSSAKLLAFGLLILIMLAIIAGIAYLDKNNKII